MLKKIHKSVFYQKKYQQKRLNEMEFKSELKSRYTRNVTVD